MIHIVYEDYGYNYESSWGSAIGYTTDKEKAERLAKGMRDAYAKYLLELPEIKGQLDTLSAQCEDSDNWDEYDTKHDEILKSVGYLPQYDFDYYDVSIHELEELP